MKQRALLSFGAIAFAPLFFTCTELRINHSKSLPFRMFLIIKGFPVQKGDLVSIEGHKSVYFSNIHLIKRIAGLAGEKVMSLHQKTLTKSGKTLSPIKQRIIPQGFFFVKASHPDSFDSRYEEFGLVSRKHVKGRAFPLW